MKPEPLCFPEPTGPIQLLIVAGEHSGDQHAARLVRGLCGRYSQRVSSPTQIAALGGPALQETGVLLLQDMMGHAVVGAVEVLRHYPFFRRLFKETLRWILEHRPAVICLVDYPGFNLRLAAKLRQLTAGTDYRPRIVYYISPQLWAWKSHRRFAMARDLDSLAVIFPFETKVYSDTNLEVVYVGHPFVKTEIQAPVNYDPQGPLLLLPGSRPGPVKRIFPILAAAFRELRKIRPTQEAVVLVPQDSLGALVEEMWQATGSGEGLTIQAVQQGPYPARAVLTSSGTMSLHCALAGIPGAIVYKAHPLTFWIGKHLVRIPWLGMANILLDRMVWPEFLQKDAQAQRLAKYLTHLESKASTLPFQEAAEELKVLLSPPESGDAADWLAKQLPQT